MDLDCSGKRVLITAAAAGIGRAIATTLLEYGARVLICDIVEERLAECKASLPAIDVTKADVADPAQVDRLFDEVAARLGGLDVLVNNAGIAGPTGLVEELDPAEWDRTLAVNISSHFYCARRAVPLLKAAGGGSIVNLSSVAGILGYPLRTPYAAAKWAVVGLSKTLAMELGEYGIRVNAICPGPVEGPRIDRVISARAQAEGVEFEEMRERYLRQNSLHVFIQAQDIANLVLFLISDAGRKFSGQALAVDGSTESLRI
jgi:NAD(P)-dependent dehydrogenase (short-subunit alcohol dehydrogenase family)